MTYSSFIRYQSIVGIATSMIFPFYILLLRNVGDSYAQFGWAYGLFTLAAALSYPVIGKVADKFGDCVLLGTYAWGMAVILLFLPLAFEIWHVYLLQIFMGILGAIQRNAEKTVLARLVEKQSAGKEIGTYHVWTSIAAAIAIIATGYLVDFLTIGSIFYVASILFAISGVMVFRMKSSVPSISQNTQTDFES
ncbi:MFS transporter [Paenisporosarcina cavernae]|uniref:MFS transporter n=1 Tax=Paenisporosarcina cavernae TaxID=2320858 RepID=A0A385YVB7_9BACL|nr:MFS transporter [Paenisporosarcina cavernae]AYC30494.1 MFS transporter [Paenisporosarcina cavernae]